MSILRLDSARAATLAVIVSALCLMLTAAPASAQCVGDCDSSDDVGINELITGVGIALGNNPVSACPSFDCMGSGVQINCLITGVNNALCGCAGCGPQPTPTVGGTSCPLDPGFYTITQVSGGSLKVATLSAFPFPPGGQLKQDVSAPDEDCVHSVVVPFPGGFSAPVFCIPALGFTTSVVQTACGIGELDSDGGSDYTVSSVGDTSDTSDACDLPHPDCQEGADSSIRIAVDVGDDTPDTCEGGGTANAIVSVPVRTTTWIEHSSGDTCPAADGEYNPGPDPVTDDFLVVEFPQILNFTTDKTSTKFEDLDGDGCFIAGRGPAAGFSATGVCLNVDAMTLSTVASGPIGSSGSPLFDLAYLTQLPNTFSGPEPLTGATCEDPPAINFDGEASQCIED